MDQFETQSKGIFKALPEVEPAPFFASRVLARLESPKSREVLIWRWVGALSLMVVLAMFIYIQKRPSSEVLFTYQPYVIQVDFNDKELALVATAEVELPEGVYFVSKNQVVRTAQRLRLPVTKLKQGRLPFVVVAEQSGSKTVQVRIYGTDEKLLNVKTVNIQFNEQRI